MLNMATQIKRTSLVATQFGVLSLPLELQQQIFRRLLVAKRAINLRRGDQPEWWTDADAIDPAIMYVCPALRDAAATTLYQENNFKFWSPIEAHHFAMLKNAEQVRSFTLMIDDPVTASWLAYFEGEDPAFSFENDFLQVNDLSLFLTRREMDIFPCNESDIFWEYRKAMICEALIRNIRVYRKFHIDDWDIPRMVLYKSSRLEGCVQRAMNGNKEHFEEYWWEINWALQHLFLGAEAKTLDWKA